MKNYLYTTVENIHARVSSINKRKAFDILDCVEWCAELELDLLGDVDRMADFFMVECVVTDNQALLPCNMYRLKDVLYSDNTRRTDYYSTGQYLNFLPGTSFDTNDDDESVVYINYKGLPVDSKTNYPLISRNHILAAQAYCMYKLYYEDYLNGDIDENRWRTLEEHKIIQCEAARNGFRDKTNDDMQRYQQVVSNMIMDPKQKPIDNTDQHYKDENNGLL